MVASEIGTLADQSAVYVKEITEVVRSVKNAFENLADNSRDILEFVDGRVRKDYELLVDTGNIIFSQWRPSEKEIDITWKLFYKYQMKKL